MSWSNGPLVEYAAHEHDRDKVLYCIEGSIVFHTSDADITMSPGDRLDLPARTVHTATVGPAGVTCWESYRVAPDAT
jgi:quercetin dioxygenase-like cupin family protein